MTGYKVYVGTASRQYDRHVVTGATTAAVRDLAPGYTHYFAVTATNALGLESSYSSEVSFAVPLMNGAPVIHGGPSLWSLAGVQAYGPMRFTASDPDGDEVALAISSAPTNGVLSGSLAALYYTPSNPPAEDGFMITARDWRSTARLWVSFTNGTNLSVSSTEQR